MESAAFKYLHEATMEELGESTPFSMCGSLPLVGDMKEAGFDVQVRDLHTSRKLSAIKFDYIWKGSAIVNVLVHADNHNI